MTTIHPIQTVTRTIWPPPIGASITGYSAEGKVLLVLPCKPKSVASFMHQRAAKADLNRLRREYDEMNLREAS